jgi:hypothetical protein
MWPMEAMNKAGLVAATKDAILASWRALREAHPSERITGYALLTDDGIQAIGSIACSQEWLTDCDEPSARFEPVEWMYGEGSSAFEEVRRLLVDSGQAAGPDEREFGTHVEQSYAALVCALDDLKRTGTFAPDVFLTVISTDPNERLRGLEEGAVRELNSEELHSQWRASRQ